MAEHPDAKVNYSAIAAQTNLTRQTISKEHKKLVEQGINPAVNELEIVYFFSEIQNTVLRAICIYISLTNESNKTAIAAALGIGRTTVDYYYDEAMTHIAQTDAAFTKSGVYALLYNNQIIYIGASNDLERRKLQHMHNIQHASKYSEGYLYQYCWQNLISSNDIVFQPLLYTANYFTIEKQMIKAIAPICNILSQEDNQ